MDDGGEVEEVEVPVDVAEPGAAVLRVVKASATLSLTTAKPTRTIACASIRHCWATAWTPT